ncbi:hypothetical protein B5F40_06000 [Gordonibacter sp. An230]|uniref:iron-sulfur cluster assembly scaffold protein n=1 Tax=Gordonibacter sp. An230 TaxID=1965592 RepID=UPI000B36EBF1|nr:iron-sulfur cluster assembly scaffold protein [Gordonibacter sp. An230]OUO90740.1 hypothetical protein B5F40_06000 [Gordonibacter sp. An230]
MRAVRIDDGRIVERAAHPTRKGFSGAYDAKGEGDNPFCGDALEVRVALERRDGGMAVARAAFDGYACTLCTACADALMERVEGMRVSEAEALAFEDVLGLWEGLEVGRTRRGCVELPLIVLKRALALLQ